MEKDAKIYITGHTGLVGSAIVGRLRTEGYTNLLVRTHHELDLTRQKEVKNFLESERPQYIIHTAAKVGGIHANITHPAEFIYENLIIQTNMIHSAYLIGAKKLLFFGSACSYPRECPQPMKEEYLLSGYLEPTNEPYAIAKIAGMKMCQAYNSQYKTNFICATFANVYGPNDHFDSNNSHVIPALIRKFHEAKMAKQPSVSVWGTGNPQRDFIFVDDVANASLFLMNIYNNSAVINVGSGNLVSIKELVMMIKDIVDYKGEIIFNVSKPDGVAYKFLDVTTLLNLGWQAKTQLYEGLKKTYNWYISILDGVCK